MSQPFFSVVVPVYNRPQELDELLNSLTLQTFRDFEVIIVEDGSHVRSDFLIDKYNTRLDLQYIYKSNSGPGPSRNVGYAKAKGKYLVVFDSDCILPEHYFGSVIAHLEKDQLDAWGGPDQGHPNFTILQRAMAYTMSSPLTTGGIRGGKKMIGWFQPRSFNMGISKKVFEATGGFQFDRYAEDIEFSIRMKERGFRVGLIADAFVYHKRRTTLKQFFWQVFNFGRGRALIGKRYPHEVRIVHWIPTLFVLAVIGWALTALISIQLFWLGCFLLGAYLAAIFVHAQISTKNFFVACLAVPSLFCQFFGYGFGFLKESIKSYSDK